MNWSILFQAGFILSALAWLCMCVHHDLRSREVPLPLLLPPLAAACLFALLRDRSAPVCLVGLLVLMSMINFEKLWLGGLAAVLLSLIDPLTAPLSLVFGILWGLWLKGALGGADVKILFTLLLFLGDVGLLVPVALCGGVQGLVALFRKQRQIPYTVAIAAGFLFYLAFSPLYA